MARVRFYIDAGATSDGVDQITNIEEVFFGGLELENLTRLEALGNLSIDNITFENLED